MNSGTSTDSTFRAWHFFVLAGLAAATAAVVLTADPTPARLILVSAAIGAAALSAAALHRTLWPLTVRSLPEGPDTIGPRARMALEREKMLAMRSIKELEFDRAMGKVSESDFHEMAGRLRGRAVNLMKQLDQAGGARRTDIEREIETRLEGARKPAVLADERQASEPQARSCPACRTPNDVDALFCKQCGTPLGTRDKGEIL